MDKIFESVDKFFSSFANYLNYNRYFIIFCALFLFTVLCVIISTSNSYESRLIKAIDMFNNYFLDNPQINEDNLIAFNNKMKSNRVPKQLRKQWQQYVLYREDKASKYMSFDSCVTIPVKNSTYTRDVHTMNILAYIFAGLCLLLNLYCSYEESLVDVLQHCLLCPILILVLNYLITIFFNIRHNAIISDLYSNYQYFEVNIDKATETLPDYVDYEVLFDKNEIKRGIPILYAYLQKRAEEEKKELERARLRNVEHEKFNFDEAGVERSLVLERAMTEAENYIAERKKLMQDMEQINNEVYQEENNFREITKEYQRQMQVSKETFDNFKQQMDDVTSSIEANYLKKQQQQELDRQRNLERDYDTATDRHKKVLETYQAEITDVENQIKKARNALEKSMMSEFDTYSGKVYDEALRVVEEREADKYNKVQDNIKSLEEKLQNKETEVNGLYTENEQLKDQLSNLDAEYQQRLTENEQIISRVSDEVSRAKHGKKQTAQQEEPPAETVQPEYSQPEYADQYNPNNGQYYDNQNYADNQYNQQYAQPDNYYQPAEQTEQTQQDETTAEQPTEQGTYTFNYLDEDNQEAQSAEQEQTPAQPEQTYTFNYLDEPEEDQANTVKPELETVEETPVETEQEEQTEQEQSTDSGETVEAELPAEKPAQEDVEISTVQTEESKPKGKPGRPRKIVTEPVEKKKPGRPRKVVAEPEIKKPGKPGRPRKVQPEQPAEVVAEQPKRKAGRPRKTETAVATPVEVKKSVGRPKKQAEPVSEQATEVVAEQPKRKAGRPRKEVSEQPKVEEPKRKAGRPKKQVETSTAEGQESKPKGKPGRPKKVVEEGTAPQTKKAVGRPKKATQSGEAQANEIQDIDAFLKEIDDEIAKENAKLEASKKELEKNTKIKKKK